MMNVQRTSKLGLGSLAFIVGILALAPHSHSETNRKPSGWNQRPSPLGENPSPNAPDGAPQLPGVAPALSPGAELEAQLAKSTGSSAIRKPIGTIELSVYRNAQGRLQVSDVTPGITRSTGITPTSSFADWDELGRAMNGESRGPVLIEEDEVGSSVRANAPAVEHGEGPAH